MTTTSDHIIASLSDKLGELQRENTRQVDEIARLAALVKSIDASRDTAEALNTPLVEELAQIRSALTAFYGLSVACDKCGAPAWKPCITDTGRFTVHSPRVTKAVAAIPADDSLTPEGTSDKTLRQPRTNHDWGCPKSPGDGSCTCGFDAEKAARAAASYLAAHAALVAAGVSEERPAAARRVADAWIALTRACADLPAGGPEQDRGAAALRPAEHAFVPHPWSKDICDAKVDDDGRSRTCTLPRGEHQS